LEAAEFKPRREPLLFSHLVRRAIQKLDQETDRKRFHVVVLNREARAFADPELILTSIAQLVDNAIQYSDPGSPIEMRVSSERGWVILKVRTKGLVLSPNERERIFERFYRAPETRHSPAGTGLGLSIVKKIVEAHHGNVWAEGDNSYGTSVSISLPVAPAA
jgi:signal transduction histidine kinase